MSSPEKLFDLGVVVARFQVDHIHDGHIALMNEMSLVCNNVMVCLGVSPAASNDQNPLNFFARRSMILDKYPNIIVIPVTDHARDDDWSEHLDLCLKPYILPGQKVCLFGARDSFIKYYSGKYQTREIPSVPHVSGSAIRKEIAKSNTWSVERRRGVIWQNANRFPIVYPTVDVAILKYDAPLSLLLCQKTLKSAWTFIGGFADVNSPSYEHDAVREAKEETGLEVGQPTYLGSALIDDWRYRGTKDKIKTLLFTVPYTFGTAKAQDDIINCKWFDIGSASLLMEVRHTVAPHHQDLFDMLSKFVIHNNFFITK